MRERVHINIHIFLCVDSCNSHNWNKCQEFGFPLSGRWKRVLLCVKWGGWNMLWNVDLKASRDIPGDIRTFARKLVMGSVDLLPFAEREDLRNNSCLLVLLNSLCVFRWTCVTHPPFAWRCTRWNIFRHWNKRQREWTHTRHQRDLYHWLKPGTG